MEQMQKQSQDETPPYSLAPEPSQAAPQEPARLGPLQRLIGTLFSPGETFEDVNRKPTWIAAAIIAAVVALAATLVFNWLVNPDWDQVTRNQIKRQIESRGAQMPPEDQIQQRVAITKTIAKFSPVLAVVFTPIYYLFLAGVFALGLMLMQAKTTFKKILSVVAWSSCATSLVGTIVFIASLMARDPEGLSSIDPTKPGGIVPSNLGFFFSSDTSAALREVASSIDIFTLWFLILLTIGFAAIAGAKKFTTKKTGALVFGLWFVWVLVKVGWAAVFGG